MNNSVFGKTMENVRGRIDFRLICDDPKALTKAASKPKYKSRTIFNEKLVGIHNHKTTVVLDKPIYVGSSILDYSKNDMYDFHYDFIKRMYNGDAKLLFTDTDSLCYSIKTDSRIWKITNLYLILVIMRKNILYIYDKTNNKQLYKMKDELGGNIMTEFIGLRAKMYSYIYTTKTNTKHKFTGKGIKKSVKINHKDFLDCFKNETIKFVEFKTLKSQKHIISTTTIKKQGLNPFDDKRYFSDNCGNTYAFGHKVTLNPRGVVRGAWYEFFFFFFSKKNL
jgi:hypothetical protein